jgi:hypothetical protein
MLKQPQELIEFLFGSSQLEAAHEDLAADITRLFERLAEAGKVELKPTPLKQALSQLGIEAELEPDPAGLCAVFDDAAAYRKALARVRTPDAMARLAELGWVAYGCGDVAQAGEPADFRLRFLELDVRPDDPAASPVKKSRKAKRQK